jgi:hypothetical protein
VKKIAIELFIRFGPLLLIMNRVKIQSVGGRRTVSEAVSGLGVRPDLVTLLRFWFFVLSAPRRVSSIYLSIQYLISYPAPASP